jgi:hypothetical protein
VKREKKNSWKEEIYFYESLPLAKRERSVECFGSLPENNEFLIAVERIFLLNRVDIKNKCF